MECQVQLVAAGRQADAAAFNLRRPVIMLPDTGKFRCRVRAQTLDPVQVPCTGSDPRPCSDTRHSMLSRKKHHMIGKSSSRCRS